MSDSEYDDVLATVDAMSPEELAAAAEVLMERAARQKAAAKAKLADPAYKARVKERARQKREMNKRILELAKERGLVAELENS
jgi:hypothetical protein